MQYVILGLLISLAAAVVLAGAIWSGKQEGEHEESEVPPAEA